MNTRISFGLGIRKSKLPLALGGIEASPQEGGRKKSEMRKYWSIRLVHYPLRGIITEGSSQHKTGGRWVGEKKKMGGE